MTTYTNNRRLPKQEHPLLSAFMGGVVIAMAIAGCSILTGCDTTGRINPRPFVVDPYLQARYPITQPIDPATKEILDVRNID